MTGEKRSKRRDKRRRRKKKQEQAKEREELKKYAPYKLKGRNYYEW